VTGVQTCALPICIGLADNLEHASVPQRDGIAAVMRELVAHQP
jgi:hypothetical protein